MIVERTSHPPYLREQPEHLLDTVARLDDPEQFPAGLGMLACNAAGGTHHAFRDRGEGYCIFNDIAVAVALGMRGMDATLEPGAATKFRIRRGRGPEEQGGASDVLCEVNVRLVRSAVVDLDVHQGNGTAAMLSSGAQGEDGHGMQAEAEQAGQVGQQA